MTKEGLENDKGCFLYHEYLYGNEAELYAFYRLPKALIENKLYVGMSAEAKLLYSLFLDRAALSASNNWKDEQGRVYIIFQVEEIMRVMGCGNQKAAKILVELEHRYGLIERKKQGFCKPNIIYVKSVTSVVLNSHLHTCENHISGSVKITSPEVLKSHTNNTNYNNTNINNTNPTTSEMVEDMFEQRNKYEKYFTDNLSMEKLIDEFPDKKEILREIVEVILETMCSSCKTIRIAKEDKPRDVVCSRFMKLEAEHIRYVLDALENATSIHNTKQYILTTLYNASMTMNSHISLQISAKQKKEESPIAKARFGYFSPDTKNEELLKKILEEL